MESGLNPTATQSFEPAARPRLDRFRGGLLTALAPSALVAVVVAADATALPFGWSFDLAAAAAAISMALQVGGAALARRFFDTGRTIWSLGWLGAALPLLPWLAERPAAVLLGSLVVAGMLALVWEWTHPAGGRRPPRDRREDGVVGAFAGAVLIAVGVITTDRAGPLMAAAMAASAVVAPALAWRSGGGGRGWRRYAVPAALLVAPVGLALVAHRIPALVALGCLALVTPLALVAQRRRRAYRVESLDWADIVLGEPGRSMVLTFLLVGGLGGAILSLPAAAAPGRAISLLDGLFTSFSAVCVTGLIVLDTPNDFSGFGQVIILLLIQVGGLGIMTFSVASLAFLGRRLRVSHERAAAELVGAEDRAQVRGVLRDVFRVTAWSEGVGALSLTLLFAGGGDPLPTALWRGLFTSVSAFCNAGFALQTDSLIPYQREPLVLFIVAALITLGGLGPIVVLALGRWLRRRRISLHARLVLVTSAILVAVSFVFILASEWRESLAHLPFGHRLVNGFFQAVTLRTAGFNSVDFTQLAPATITLMMVMMFIGGSPGSTAGGVKTTTAAVLALVVRAALRGEQRPVVAHFRLSSKTVYEATAVFAMGLTSALTAIVLLQLTQVMAFDMLAFETFSALGTVGLSIGGTALLDSVGKVLIIGAMFAGRVGPLTLFFFLSRRVAVDRLERPEREIPVG